MKNARYRRVSSPSGGFTLVELLLALVITSLLISAVYGIFHTSLRAYRRTSDDMRLGFESGFLADTLGRDLRGAAMVEMEEMPCFRGDATRIEFMTRASAPGEGRWPLRRVTYEFEKAADAATGTLSADVQPYAGAVPLQPGSSRHVVLERIGDLRFRYYTNNRWQEEWTGEGLPQAVEITARITIEDSRMTRTLEVAVDLPCFAVTGR